jgi:hypothetical protein
MSRGPALGPDNAMCVCRDGDGNDDDNFDFCIQTLHSINCLFIVKLLQCVLVSMYNILIRTLRDFEIMQARSSLTINLPIKFDCNLSKML